MKKTGHILHKNYTTEVKQAAEETSSSQTTNQSKE